MSRASEVVPMVKGSDPDSVVANERLANIAVQELMVPRPLHVGVDTPIRQAAQLMHEHRISCLPVVVGERLVGLVTEADFVGKVVARGSNPDAPVASVMSVTPHTVSAQQSILDVLTLMTRHQISHMPVTFGDELKLVGIVTQTDVIRHQIATSVFMVSDIARMNSSAAIAGVVRQLPRLLCSLVDNGNSVYETGRVMTSITGAVTRRLIELAERDIGPPPVPFVWLACGSQGRQEQTAATDQDNCLMLDDRFSPEEHDQYFSALAKFVCDGLDEAGYVYCPGNMMATNIQWRQPLSVWRDYFKKWIEKPGPQAQMLASVMFDLRPIAGDNRLYEPLQKTVATLASDNSIFVAHMASNCLAHRPPLGWFGRLKTKKNGTHVGTIDLKHDGIVPIVDLARLYALSSGSKLVNSVDRLRHEVDSGLLSPAGAAQLSEAYTILSSIRLKHQVKQIKQKKTPDNYLDPTSLDSADRRQMREAMKNIQTIQSAIGNRIAAVAR